VNDLFDGYTNGLIIRFVLDCLEVKTQITLVITLDR